MLVLGEERIDKESEDFFYSRVSEYLPSKDIMICVLQFRIRKHNHGTYHIDTQEAIPKVCSLQI